MGVDDGDLKNDRLSCVSSVGSKRQSEYDSGNNQNVHCNKKDHKLKKREERQQLHAK